MKRYLTVVLMIMLSLSGITNQAQARDRGIHKGLLMDPLLIETGYIAGTMIGDPENPVHIYRGIPYAAPPVGDLRWRPPQPVVPWSGIKECTVFQADPVAFTWGPGLLPPSVQSEDCLYLNVLTPARHANEKLPVMVWFHGGGLTYGAGNEAHFNLPSLPEGGVVLVNVNERLGAFGLLAHPWLTDESENDSSGNYLFLDLIQSLKWVQENIAVFGGDPDNVTIFGESGGGVKVTALMASPLATGLFHRAIIESGSALAGEGMSERIRPLADWEAVGEEFLANLYAKFGVESLADARALTTQEIYEAAEGFDWNRGGAVDGWFLPDSVTTLFQEGDYNAVPMIICANLGEITPVGTAPIAMPYGIRWIEPVLAAQESMGVPAFAALFDRVPNNWRAQGAPSCHAMELAYVFGDYDPSSTLWSVILHFLAGSPADPLPILTETDISVSQDMISMWAQFAKTGNPSVRHLIRWPKWSKAKDKYLYITDSLEILEGFTEVDDFLND